ncbi:MAG: Phenylalanyl-tRNA synthetase, beta subunit, cytoplasmic [Watsoniomyces obsoletus]|nr:MAG: Phenylalanyl-tRNA synthetase, beta subunit, cytoplasmic [Watsoniomyces obsoletus]
MPEITTRVPAPADYVQNLKSLREFLELWEGHIPCPPVDQEEDRLLCNSEARVLLIPRHVRREQPQLPPGEWIVKLSPPKVLFWEPGGEPKTIVLGVCEDVIYSGASKDSWPANTFLRLHSKQLRRYRFGERGLAEVRSLVQQVTDRLKEVDEHDHHRAFQELVSQEYTAVNLPYCHAQAYETRFWRPKARCPRYRITLGFSWVCPEGPAKLFRDLETDGEYPGTGGEYPLWNVIR